MIKYLFLPLTSCTNRVACNLVIKHAYHGQITEKERREGEKERRREIESEGKIDIERKRGRKGEREKKERNMQIMGE